VFAPDSNEVLLVVPGRDRSVEEIPLDPADDSARISLYRVELATGTPVLIGQLPLSTATGFYPAGWSNDGVVIANGYAMKFSGE
jgi:hypothetical protein